jgi:hypothetical protein
VQRLADLGLGIVPRNFTSSMALAIAVGLLFGTYMALADRFLFSTVVPEFQISFVKASSAPQRLVFYAQVVVFEEIAYRLLVLTTLVWAAVALSGTIRPWCYWVAILTTALVLYPLGHLAYLASLPPTTLSVAREIALHGSAGILWGYLYWRYGLLASIGGHVAAHLSLQPLLSIL